MIVVSGFGRCGSSLTMQMLSAAGCKMTGEYPSFEDIRATRLLPHDSAWLDSMANRVVKILDPLRFYPADLGKHRMIWLDRHPRQQAKSWAKLMRAAGHADKVNKDSMARVEKLLKRDRDPSLDLVWRHSDKKGVLVAKFETILANPKTEAERLAEHCEIDAKVVPRMVAAVVSRGPKCLPHLMEEQLAAGQR